ncbi:MAG TPA: GHMP kinase, partial [Methanocorpusculum sp.]|nr:GHMP kinase [Methanocorpusculum sp.]
MGRRVVVFAPGHISGYFQRVDGTTTGTTGSLGAGIVISRGVRLIMSEADASCISIKNSTDDGWLIKEVLRTLGVSASVTVDAEMPIGAGFGMSAAGLLASYHAANRLFDLGYSDAELTALAHDFEVRHGTGLGDVAAASGGGIVVRTSAGIEGVEKRIFTDEPIYAVSFGAIPTPDIITSPEKMEKVREAFPACEPNDLGSLMENSRSFAEKSGLLTPRLKEILAACDAENIQASMTMLGEGIFAFGKDAKSILSKFGEVY